VTLGCALTGAVHAQSGNFGISIPSTRFEQPTFSGIQFPGVRSVNNPPQRERESYRLSPIESGRGNRGQAPPAPREDAAEIARRGLRRPFTGPAARQPTASTPLQYSVGPSPDAVRIASGMSLDYRRPFAESDRLAGIRTPENSIVARLPSGDGRVAGVPLAPSASRLSRRDPFVRTLR
jgi:hypothetical protein